MRVVAIAFLVVFFSSLTLSQAKGQPDIQKSGKRAAEVQDRQAALQKYNKLKATAAALEKVLLAPEKQDIEAAKKENVNVIRIMPRETYDNSLSSIRGGGSYYSFYFRIPDWGHGSDIALEQNIISTGLSRFGVMADLGVIPLSDISAESKDVQPLAIYQSSMDRDAQFLFQTVRQDGLKIENTVFATRLTPNVGHTYVLRSSSDEYYDVLVAFKIFRKDSDGSLIIFWKTLRQFETPRRRARASIPSDDVIQNRSKGWLHDKRFRDVTVTVDNGVTTLRGTIDKDVLAYAVQLANGDGASKVVNMLSVR